MAYMIDSEGEEIPQCEYKPLFNLSLFRDRLMSMSAPAFSTIEGDYTAQTGVFEVSIFDVFDEFLSDKDNLVNQPDEPFLIAAKLSEYAAKFEAMAALIASMTPPEPISEADLNAFVIAGVMILKSVPGTKTH